MLSLDEFQLGRLYLLLDRLRISNRTLLDQVLVNSNLHSELLNTLPLEAEALGYYQEQQSEQELA